MKYLLFIPFCIQDDMRQRGGSDAGILLVLRGAEDEASKESA
jgi:hypothetical protein